MLELLFAGTDTRPHQEGTSPAITLRSRMISTAVATVNHTLDESNFQYKRLNLKTGANTSSNTNSAGNRTQVINLTLPIGYEFEIANEVRFRIRGGIGTFYRFRVDINVNGVRVDRYDRRVSGPSNDQTGTVNRPVITVKT